MADALYYRDMGSRSLRSLDPALRPVLPWRFVAGVFLHFAAPAYIISAAISVLLSSSGDGSWRAILDEIIAFSAPFLMIYTGTTLAACGLAALLDPLLQVWRVRRLERDPLSAVRLSEQRLAEALSLGRQLCDDQPHDVLDAIAGIRWIHADPRY